MIWDPSEVFSVYDGDQICNDFTIDHSDVTVLRSYEPGVGHVTDPLDLPNRVAKYYHPDKVGTTRMMSFSGGTATDASVYTAFGELIDGTNHRYGYVGKEGYQAHDEFSLLHVGARYYDPNIGRFIQRDRIGIKGGLNVYLYGIASPLTRVDPNGLSDAPLMEWHARHEGVLVLWSFGMAGAAVGEATCAVIGLGWLWGTDKFETGDLFGKVHQAIEKLEGHGESSSSDGRSGSSSRGDFPGPPADGRRFA